MYTEETSLIKKMPKLVTNNTKTILVLQSFIKQFLCEKTLAPQKEL